MRLVIVESPFAGRGSDEAEQRADNIANIAYAKELCRALVLRECSPYASHLLLTQFLDDADATERRLGIEAGFAWGLRADVTMVGVDRGASYGVRLGVERALAEGRPVEFVTTAKGGWTGVSDGVFTLMQLVGKFEVRHLVTGETLKP